MKIGERIAVYSKHYGFLIGECTSTEEGIDEPYYDNMVYRYDLERNDVFAQEDDESLGERSGG